MIALAILVAATSTTTSAVRYEVSSSATDLVVETAALSDVEVESYDEAETFVSRDKSRVHVRCTNGGRVHLRVPHGAVLDLETRTGDVLLRGRLAELIIHSTSGDVSAEVTARRIDMSTLSGDVVLGGGAPRLDVTSISGDLVVDGTSAEANIQTTSGDLAWSGDLPRRMELRTVSGEVEMDGALAVDAMIRIRSTSSDVHIRPRGKVGYRVEARTHSGEVVAGDERGTHVDTLVRGGGASFEVRTFSGDVVIGD